jgi:hypothetical protein
MAAADQARGLVRKWLGDYLERTTFTSEETVLTHTSRFLPLLGGAITVGPATVTVGSGTVTASAVDGFTVERFGLRRKFGYYWPSGTRINVTYDVGWYEGAEPMEVQEAIIVLTTFYETNPGAGLGELDIGNARASRIGANRADGRIEPPISARLLLRGWTMASF